MFFNSHITFIKESLTIWYFLKHEGFEPVKREGRFLRYVSPIRPDDHAPSFWVDTTTNLCGDFSTGPIGDVVNLAVLLWQCSTREAVRRLYGEILKGYFQDLGPIEIKARADGEQGNAPAIQIKHLQELRNRALIQYCEARAISAQTAARYLKECYYTINGRKYFALAFANDKGGLELRNARYKGGTTPKGITTIPGTRPETVAIFEGFFDYLAAVEYWRAHTAAPSIPYTVIVLNSVAFVDSLNLDQYQEIKLILDRDNAGQAAAAKILGRYPTRAKNLSPRLISEGCKDFAEYWQLCKQNI